MNAALTYVTETVTETDTVTVPVSSTYSDPGPDLFLPTPGCSSNIIFPTRVSLSFDGGLPTSEPPASQLGGETTTVHATIKTREVVTGTPSVAITFGGGGGGGESPPGEQVPGNLHNDGPSTAPFWGSSGRDSNRVLPTALLDTTPSPHSDSGDSHIRPGPTPDVTVNSIPVAVRPGSVVIGGSTFSVGNAPTSQLQVINGQTFTILPSGGVVAPGGMTITPAPPAPTGTTSPDSTAPAYTAETVAGVPVDVGASQVIIDGQTVAIGPGAAATTLEVNGHAVSAGPFGVAVAGSTVPPFLAGSETFTADGSKFSLNPHAVIINGILHAFSSPTQVVVGSETISVGTNGVDLLSTTIAPPYAAATGQSSDAKGAAPQRQGHLPWLMLLPPVVLALPW